jgi:molecular chaperone GrpE
MSEPAPPAVPGHAAEGHEGPLTPDAIARVVDDFRLWLTELSAQGLGAMAPHDRPEPPDLHTLLGQMIAVRQEVNLQTKAVRAQQEQNTETLEILREAVDELHGRPSAAAPSSDEQVRSLLKVLVDVHDALSLALREAERVQESIPALLDHCPDLGDQDVANIEVPAMLTLGSVEVPALEQSGRPLLARMLGAGVSDKALAEWRAKARECYETAATERLAAFLAREKERAVQRSEGLSRVRQILASLMAGYRMGLQRVERALQQSGLEAITALGESFDPELMEVVEAVADSGRPAGEVLQEVRRGYLWRGRVFRYTQVRVARS